MDWIMQLIRGNDTNAVAHAMIVIAVVAALGMMLGQLKIKEVGLGVAGVLFSGLIIGHIYSHWNPSAESHGAVNNEVLEFIREFGLILFVYTIGVQVGPGFLASLRKQGLPLNLMAAAIVILGAIITIGITKFGHVRMTTAVGLFSGATTNTPSLAAAQQALKDIKGITLDDQKLPALGYAVAYPFGIIGIILTMILTRVVFRIDTRKELDVLEKLKNEETSTLGRVNLEVRNPNLEGMSIRKIPNIRDSGVVISRISSGETARVAHGDTTLRMGDVLLAVGPKEELEALKVIVGTESKVDLTQIPGNITTRRVIVTKSSALGETIAELHLNARYGVMVTRVRRADIDLPPAGLKLQFGDSLTVVGEPEAIDKLGKEFGDSLKQLNHPQVIPIFIGIVFGVLLGSWPFHIPGIPAPVKLGLAGGPLVAAIILSRIGHIGPFVWYMNSSANYVMREIGIVLFLACVGLKAGDKFLVTLTQGDGFYWMALAALITIVPLMIVAFVARFFYKVNFLSLCGLLAGSMTDPPALAFAGSVTHSDAPSVSYATVYPLVMLLRVVSAQALVLLFVT